MLLVCLTRNVSTIRLQTFSNAGLLPVESVGMKDNNAPSLRTGEDA